MSDLDDAFKARMKRVRARSGSHAPMPDQRRVADGNLGEHTMPRAILLPQLALILGAAAMVAGRAIAMNSLAIEPNTDVLGWGEGAVVFLLLLVIGFLLGKSEVLSHGALVVGAALGFLLEGYYIPFVPEFMGSLYNPDYVALVILNGP